MNSSRKFSRFRDGKIAFAYPLRRNLRIAAVLRRGPRRGNAMCSWRRTIHRENALHFSASLAGKTYSCRITEISSSRLRTIACLSAPSPLSLSVSFFSFSPSFSTVLRNCSLSGVRCQLLAASCREQRELARAELNPVVAEKFRIRGDSPADHLDSYVFIRPMTHSDRPAILDPNNPHDPFPQSWVFPPYCLNPPPSGNCLILESRDVARSLNGSHWRIPFAMPVGTEALENSWEN